MEISPNRGGLTREEIAVIEDRLQERIANRQRRMVESNRKLIEIFEAKIKAKLDEIWGGEGNSRKEAQGE